MKRPDFGAVIASVDFVFLHTDGIERSVQLRIGVPYRDEHGAWSCPSELAGFEARYPDMSGGDSVQALCLALTLVRRRIEDFMAKGGKVLFPDDHEAWTLEGVGATFGDVGTHRSGPEWDPVDPVARSQVVAEALPEMVNIAHTVLGDVSVPEGFDFREPLRELADTVVHYGPGPATSSAAHASVRFSGSSLDPLDVTNRLRLPHDHAHRSGEPRVVRRRSDQSVREYAPYREGMWSMSSERWVTSSDLNVHIRWLLEQLEPRGEQVLELLRTGVEGDIFCYSFGASSQPPTVDEDLAARARALSLPIEIDHYESDEDS